MAFGRRCPARWPPGRSAAARSSKGPCLRSIWAVDRQVSVVTVWLFSYGLQRVVCLGDAISQPVEAGDFLQAVGRVAQPGDQCGSVGSARAGGLQGGGGGAKRQGRLPEIRDSAVEESASLTVSPAAIGGQSGMHLPESIGQQESAGEFLCSVGSLQHAFLGGCAASRQVVGYVVGFLGHVRGCDLQVLSGLGQLLGSRMSRRAPVSWRRPSAAAWRASTAGPRGGPGHSTVRP